MLVYLSKKIAIPNDVHLTCVAWHGAKGYIACGGKGGLLKVLKLEPQEDREGKLKGLAAPSNLTMNQTLEGHDSSLHVVTWNEVHHRMTSSDHNGLIIVWLLYKGTWCEEMINNRNRSIVRDMQWNKDGQKICIVYEDGAVIVGSVDGNRIWGKDIKGVQLTQVAWSPDSKVILFGTGTGEVHIYDSHGSYNTKMNIQCLVGATGMVKLASVEWYSGLNGYAEPNCPSLIVVYDNGRAQLMKNELDESPIVMKIDLISVIQARWNHTGSQLAFAGTQHKEISVIQFYNTFGQHLHTLKVPGKSLCSVSWEGNGLRLAIGVAQHIYFANIRHDYKWGYFSNTIVYSFRKPEKLEHCLVFWNMTTGERIAKSVKRLLHVTTCRDLALLVAKVEDSPTEYVLLLCNALGTPLESKYIQMEPQFVSISHTHVVAASSSAVYVWHYCTASRLAMTELTLVSRKGWDGQERLIHVDEEPSEKTETVDFSKASTKTSDPICCVSSSDQGLIVGRESGTLQYYSLPRVLLEGRVVHNSKPHHVGINCTTTKFSVIDTLGFLSLYEMDINLAAQGGAVATQLPLQRKEVWQMLWAEDNPDMFAMMEKTRMYIFRGVDPEEPVQSSAHMCRFKDMTVKSALMDEILQDPENPSTQDHLLTIDIKSLRDTRSLLQNVGLKDTCQFIEDNPHPRLWKLLAEASLEKLDLEMAEKAFVRCEDYHGIQFVKQLHHLDSEVKQRAQVASYSQKFDEAEKMYLELDCHNLAVDLRVKLGDWFKVVNLLKKGGGAVGDDKLVVQAWNMIGDYFYDRQQWQNAVTFYAQGHCPQRLAECYYSLEDYNHLQQLSDSLPDNNPLLPKLAMMFASVGMSDEAVSAYVKVNMINEAMDCCVEQNQWDKALELAKRHSSRDIDGLLVKYASHLLDKRKILSTVELYRKANHFVKAAQLLTEVAKKAAIQGLSPLKIKKLYVLAALLIEQHLSHVKTRAQPKVKASPVSSSIPHRKDEVHATLASLLQDDSSETTDPSLVDNAWRGAEAYHFFMLAQREVYTGSPETSLKICLYLREYEDILPVCDLYCLLALSSLMCGAYGVASKAFIKLESMTEEVKCGQLDDLSVEIFTKYAPRDTISNQIQCPRCDAIINEWTHACPSCHSNIPMCIATGQPLLEYHSWVCRRCHRRAYEHDVKRFCNCPLCHTPVHF